MPPATPPEGGLSQPQERQALLKEYELSFQAQMSLTESFRRLLFGSAIVLTAFATGFAALFESSVELSLLLVAFPGTAIWFLFGMQMSHLWFQRREATDRVFELEAAISSSLQPEANTADASSPRMVGDRLWRVPTWSEDRWATLSWWLTTGSSGWMLTLYWGIPMLVFLTLLLNA